MEIRQLRISNVCTFIFDCCVGPYVQQQVCLTELQLQSSSSVGATSQADSGNTTNHTASVRTNCV